MGSLLSPKREARAVFEAEMMTMKVMMMMMMMRGVMMMRGTVIRGQVSDSKRGELEVWVEAAIHFLVF